MPCSSCVQPSPQQQFVGLDWRCIYCKLQNPQGVLLMLELKAASPRHRHRHHHRCRRKMSRRCRPSSCTCACHRGHRWMSRRRWMSHRGRRWMSRPPGCKKHTTGSAAGSRGYGVRGHATCWAPAKGTMHTSKPGAKKVISYRETTSCGKNPPGFLLLLC